MTVADYSRMALTHSAKHEGYYYYLTQSGAPRTLSAKMAGQRVALCYILCDASIIVIAPLVLQH